METKGRMRFAGRFSLPKEVLLSTRASPAPPEQAGSESWRLVRAGRCPLHSLSFLAGFWFSTLFFLTRPVAPAGGFSRPQGVTAALVFAA